MSARSNVPAGPVHVRATLYVSVECESPADARAMLGRFVSAGLNTSSPLVHVAVGDPVDA